MPETEIVWMLPIRVVGAMRTVLITCLGRAVKSAICPRARYAMPDRDVAYGVQLAIGGEGERGVFREEVSG
eukprot:2425235-Rhodomonas_salina.1